MSPAGWKLAAKLVLLLAAAAALWWAVDRVYDRGVRDENARWIDLQAKADAKARADEQAATKASEHIGDTTRARANAAMRATATLTTDSVARIHDVYARTPPAPCAADGGPRPLPASVRDELDQAVAAVAAAAR